MRAEEIQGVEAIVNADEEVALVVRPLAHRPTSWRDMGEGVVALFAGAKAIARFGCPPDILDAMAAKRRALVVETASGPPTREGWVSQAF